MFESFNTVNHYKFFQKDRKFSSSTLTERWNKTYLNGFLCNLSNEYMKGTLQCLAASSLSVEIMCLSTICFSAKCMAWKIEEISSCGIYDTPL